MIEYVMQPASDEDNTSSLRQLPMTHFLLKSASPQQLGHVIIFRKTSAQQLVTSSNKRLHSRQQHLQNLQQALVDAGEVLHNIIDVHSMQRAKQGLFQKGLLAIILEGPPLKHTCLQLI